MHDIQLDKPIQEIVKVYDFHQYTVTDCTIHQAVAMASWFSDLPGCERFGGFGGLDSNASREHWSQGKSANKV